MQPLFRLILFALLVLIPFTAKSDSWEVLRGIDYFYNVELSGETINFYHGDTLFAYGYVGTKYKMLKYIDKKWTSSYDLRQEILSATQDTELISFLNHPKFSIDAIDLDKENNMWINCKILPKMYSQFSINCLLKKTNDGVTKYDKFYRADSNRYESINNFVKVQFDNFNTPYIICHSILSTDSSDKNTYINNILKIEDDTLKLVLSMPSINSSGDRNGVIRFDSKNNYWLSSLYSLYYIAQDTVSRRYGLDDVDLPKDSTGIVNLGAFINIFLDNSDNLTAVLSSDAIFTFSNNAWSLDTTASAFIRSVNLLSSMTLDADKVQLDTNGNLWITTEGLPYLMQRNAEGKWAFHLIPYIDYTPFIPIGTSSSKIILLDNNKIWLFVESKSSFTNGLIYTIKWN